MKTFNVFRGNLLVAVIDANSLEEATELANKDKSCEGYTEIVERPIY